MPIPSSQRFKRGVSSRPYKGVVTDGNGDPVDLTAVTGLTARVRRQQEARGSAVSLAVSNETSGGAFEVDFSSLDPGLYWFELEFTDGGGKLHKPPADLTTPGIEIEIVDSVG